MNLPDSFLEQVRALLGADEAGLFLDSMKHQPTVSIRFNPGKKSNIGTFSGPHVPWHPNGIYLPERPVFTLDPHLHAGAYYVQEASSMFLYQAVSQHADLSKPLKILDLCAAPGGKSTILADLAGKNGFLVSNETIRTRTGALRENMEKWGYPNTAIVSAEADAFAALPGFFDVLVADAPCSGEGLFRKDENAVREWSPENVRLCAVRQKKILESSVESLAPGGLLVYSTCTFNAQENDANARWFAETYDLEPLSIAVMPEWNIEARSFGYQFWPHRLRGEGFFLAAFRKRSGTVFRSAHSTFKSLMPAPKAQLPAMLPWLESPESVRLFQTPSGETLALPANWIEAYLALDKALKIKWFGVNIGVMKGKDFVPDHALAQSKLAAAGLPGVELPLELALRFLKKETFDLPAGSPTGWLLARYGGLNLGWIKALPNRMNNYLPQERRIRMDYLAAIS